MKRNSVTLKEALDAMVNNLKLKGGLDESRVREAWPRLMGKPIAKYTTSVSLRKGKLYITVNSAALKNELHYSRDKIKELFNKELNDEVIREVIVY